MARQPKHYENHNVLPMIKEAASIGILIEEKIRLAGNAREIAPHRISKIMAVDPGTANCAVALICRNVDTGELETVCTTKIEPPEDFKGKPFQQALYVQRILEQFILDHVPQVVVKEDAAYNAPMQAHQLGRAHQAIDMACFNTGRALLVVNTNSMRSFLGAHSKDEIRQKIYKRYGIEFPTEHEADAFGLGKTGEAIIKGEYPKPKAKAEKKPAAVKAPAKKKAPARKATARKKSRR